MKEQRKKVDEIIAANDAHWRPKSVLRIETAIWKKLGGIKKNVYEIGRLLSEAKKIMTHGQYEPWIKDAFGDELPLSTASLYKQIYDRFKDRPDIVLKVPVTYLLEAMKDLPSGTIEEIEKALQEKIEKQAAKHAKQSIEKQYALELRRVVEGFKGIKKNLGCFGYLPKHIENLCNGPYKATEIMGFLTRLQEENFIRGIDDTIQILTDVKKSFLSTLNACRQKVVNE